jgi:hypothetical protein
MDYDKQMREMMIHMGNNFSPEEFAAFTRSCSIALAETMALIADKATLAHSLSVLFQTMAEYSLDAWDTMNKQQQEARAMPAEEFLRHVFNPTQTND